MDCISVLKDDVVYVTSTCSLMTFLTLLRDVAMLLRDVAKRQFQNIQKNFT